MKRVAILGGGPAGAFAAQQLSAAGLETVVFDEKLAWEKPCGGGLTYKAYHQYPFLIDNNTPKKLVSETVLAAPKAGAVTLRLRKPILIYSRFDLNRLLLDRAARAGARIEKARVTEMTRSGSGWRLKTKCGTLDADFCIVATGARNPLRQVGTELTQSDAMSALGYYVPGDREQIDIQFLPELEGYIWVFPRCGHLSVGICGKGEPALGCCASAWKLTCRKRASRGRAPRFTATCCPRSRRASWKRNRVAGDGWMAVGDAAGLVDPITGEGLYYAIRSADLAAKALLSEIGDRAGQAYRRMLRRDFAADLEFGSRLAKRIFLGKFSVRRRARPHGAIYAQQPEIRRHHAGPVRGIAIVYWAKAAPDRESQWQPARSCHEREPSSPGAGPSSGMTRARSEKLFSRAQKRIPGGVNSPVRAFRGVGGSPIFIARGKGSRIFDADGNEYIDYVGSWGPLLLGHAHPAILAALSEALQLGTSFGAPTEREIDLAEAICDAVPSIEMVRLVNSGTEATMSAIRLARAFTGRDLIVKFEGCYHGHVDSLLVKAGSGVATLGLPDSPGVPKSFSDTTIALPFNSREALERAFRAHGSHIAAAIVEPVAGNMGCVPPAAGFLEALREITAGHGSLLILDEVMTGFRVAFGGAQQLYGIRPDLTTLGKVIGGGLPIGAYGGRADIMSRVAPAGPVYQAGTLSGNPLAVAAGLAMLRYLKSHPEIYRQLEARTAAICAAAPRGTTVNRVGSMFTFFFIDGSVTDYDSARKSDTARFAEFHRRMLDRGIYFPPSQFEAAFVSTAHSEEDVANTVAQFHAPS